MPATASMSLSDLQRLIDRRQRELRKLSRRREKIQRKLDDIDDRIAALGGAGSFGRSRPRNEVSLNDAIAQVLEKAAKPMAVGDILERVQRAGYRSGSVNFRGIVNQTLIKDKRFTAVSRGVYQMRSR